MAFKERIQLACAYCRLYDWHSFQNWQTYQPTRSKMKSWLARYEVANMKKEPNSKRRMSYPNHFEIDILWRESSGGPALWNVKCARFPGFHSWIDFANLIPHFFLEKRNESTIISLANARFPSQETFDLYWDGMRAHSRYKSACTLRVHGEQLQLV